MLGPTISYIDPLYEYSDGGSWLNIKSNTGDLTQNTTVVIGSITCDEVWYKDGTEIYAKLPAQPVGEYDIKIINAEHGTTLYPTPIQYIDPAIGPYFNGTVPVRVMTEPYPDVNLNSGRTPNSQNAIAYYSALSTYRTYGFSLSWVHMGESKPPDVETISYILIKTNWYCLWRVGSEKYAYATVKPSGTLNVVAIAFDAIPIEIEQLTGIDSSAFGTSEIGLQSDEILGPMVGWDSLQFGTTSIIENDLDNTLSQIQGIDYSTVSEQSKIQLESDIMIGPVVEWDSSIISATHSIKIEPELIAIILYSAPFYIDHANVSINICNTNDTAIIFKLAITDKEVPTNEDYIEDYIHIPANGGVYFNNELVVSPEEKVVGFFELPCTIRTKSILVF